MIHIFDGAMGTMLQAGGPDVDAGLDDEVVDAGLGERAGLLLEARIGFFEVEVTERADEAARRTHGAGDLGARAGQAAVPNS